MDTSKNLFPHKHFVDANLRRKLTKQKPILIWLSGLSGSGKSTIANELEKKLQAGEKYYSVDDKWMLEMIETPKKNLPPKD